MIPGGEPSPRSRWEDWSTWPLLVASFVFIAAYTVVVVDTSLTSAQYWSLHVVIWLIWVAFAVDYVVRLILARDRWGFARHNVPDLLSVMVPIFRPFRLLKYLREIPYFRNASGAALRTQLVVQAVAFVVIFVYTISLAELQVERGAPGATITSYGDSLWWACVTMATVGYGDMVPVTVAGRILAVLLMIGGVAIVGVTSATVISYLNERIAPVRQAAAASGLPTTARPEPGESAIEPAHDDPAHDDPPVSR